MDDIESAEEDDQWERIQKADVKPGMFVSGWEDPNDEVEEDTDPHGKLIVIFVKPHTIFFLKH